MPKWLKIVLGLFAALVLLCGVSGFVAYRWLDNNKDRLKSMGDSAVKEGTAWGQAHDANSCVDEAMRRNDAEGGIVNEAGHAIFMRSCLDHAQRPPGFCDGVPAKNDIFQTAEWTVKKCLALNRAGDQPCTRMVKAIQESCAKKP